MFTATLFAALTVLAASASAAPAAELGSAPPANLGARGFTTLQERNSPFISIRPIIESAGEENKHHWCLDVPDNNMYDGARVQFWTCNFEDSQYWIQDGDRFVKYNADSNAEKLCLDFSTWDNGYPELANGNQGLLRQCEKLPMQDGRDYSGNNITPKKDTDKYRQNFQLTLGKTNWCLDVKDGALYDGANPQLWECNSWNWHQYWYLQAEGKTATGDRSGQP